MSLIQFSKIFIYSFYKSSLPKIISDEKYAIINYFLRTGKYLNYKRPTTFDEKLWYLNIYENKTDTSSVIIIRKNEINNILNSIKFEILKVIVDNGGVINSDKIIQPTPKKELILVNHRMVYPRSREIALRALAYANFLCEVKENHPTFKRKRILNF